MSARLKGSIQHEYGQKLEAHKAQLKAENEIALLELKTTIERESVMHATAHASFSEGQKAAMERKLNAVDNLWKEVIAFREKLPPVLSFFDVLTVSEYKSAQNHRSFQEFSRDLNGKMVYVDRNENPQIECVRPYVGEYTWAIYSLYRAIMMRLLFLLYSGRADASKLEWHKDSGVLQLMKMVFSKKELDEYDVTKIGKVSWLHHRIEAKILNAISKVISGEEFGEEALKQARIIQEHASQLQAENKKA